MSHHYKRFLTHATVLMLERGGFWLPTHYQMLPTAFQATTVLQTTYPWSRTSEMSNTGMRFFQSGYTPPGPIEGASSCRRT